jgi:protein-S-isoprenylcysteine O-methyltransferase Ste14
MKRLAFALPVALTRGASLRTFGIEASSRTRGRRDWGELAAKATIVMLFSMMAMRLSTDFAKTGHVTGLLLVASEALVVVLTVFRRSAGIVDRSVRARLLTLFATFGPPLVRPAAASIIPMTSEAVTIFISAVGLMIVIIGKVSLGRSFGLTPANRGIVCTGLYRFVRHPIYLGYLISHVGFLLANPLTWNLFVLVAADIALVMRARVEEETLAHDRAYRGYMQRVRFRLLPGLF